MSDEREREAEVRFLKAVNSIVETVKSKNVKVNCFQFFVPGERDKLLNN